MSERDSVTVSVEVAIDPAGAFDAFTGEVGAWYKRDRFTLPDHSKTVDLRFEPFVGGRFLDVHDAETGEGREMGRIVVWEPGERLVFVDGRTLEVEVTFRAAPAGCTVTVEQRGLDRLAPDVADHVRRYGWHTLLGWYVDHVAAGTGGAR